MKPFYDFSLIFVQHFLISELRKYAVWHNLCLTCFDKDLSHQDVFPPKKFTFWSAWSFIKVTGNRATLICPYVSQGAQSPVWWWLMYGVTCPCWTTGIWCLGWRWPAADTTVWCTMANSTPLEVWACRETWIMWRGKIHTYSATVSEQQTHWAAGYCTAQTQIWQLPQNRH